MCMLKSMCRCEQSIMKACCEQCTEWHLTVSITSVCACTGGFGMNTGVQDAHNLAWKLAMVAHAQPSASTCVDSAQQPGSLLSPAHLLSSYQVCYKSLVVASTSVGIHFCLSGCSGLDLYSHATPHAFLTHSYASIYCHTNTGGAATRGCS